LANGVGPASAASVTVGACGDDMDNARRAWDLPERMRGSLGALAFALALLAATLLVSRSAPAAGDAEAAFRDARVHDEAGEFARALEGYDAVVASAPDSPWAERAVDRIAWLRARSVGDVRGFDGSQAAERAIERLATAGVRVGVNVVLTRASFPRLGETLARARTLGAREAQLLRYKPAGRAASLDYRAQRLTAEQGLAFGGTLRTLSRALCSDGRFPIRIDCALVPFLSTDPELAADPARLARLGVFGCEAGGALAAVTADGRVAPCSFAPATSMRGQDLPRDHQDDEELARWRAWSRSPPEPCGSCSIRDVCKGGCKIVSAFVDGAHGADPECPRVVAWRRAEPRS
jgi:radical SAM protein with 4Fe4S-binding SPASM domain